MIKNIFIPEKIGSYYIFSKRILGIDIGKTHVNGTQLYLKGKNIVLEKFIEIPLEAGNGNNYAERVGTALKILMAQVDRYDEIHTALSSSLIITKELRLPFIGHDKIALVVEFEVEPLLPFSVNDAVVDFIITKENLEEKSSEILVAAVQKIHIAQHLQLFEQIGLNPDVITIDLFALYGLYKQLPSYEVTKKQNVALLDLGSHTTRIAYLEQGQLRFIRSLPKGIATIAKTVSESLNMQPNEAMETIIRFGLERYDTPRYTEAISSAITQFWHDIGFTLSTFSGSDTRPLERILVFGGGAEIKGLTTFVGNLLNISCEQMPIHEVTQLPFVSTTNKNPIPLSNLISLSAAFPSSTTADFNLRQKEFAISGNISVLNKQLIVAVGLAVLLIGSLMTYSFFQTRKLSSEAYESEQEVINSLKEQFPKPLEDVTDLEEAIEQAQLAVNQEEKLWFSFANPSRISFLTFLLELTSKIDKKSLGFTIDKLTITEGMMTMTAHVRDHAALALLEKSLRQSKLFAHVEGQQNPDFTMKIKLAKNV